MDDSFSTVQGGAMTLPVFAQIVYLDFDGELTKYRNQDLNLDIDVTVEDSRLSRERIKQITDSLNEQYASQNVHFVTERPEDTEYSTIYVGKTSSFSRYGTFAGLAEAIDSGNQNQSDNAFVILDSTSDNAQIISTISHELDHLLGTLDHGGEGLEKYAYSSRYDVSSGVTSTGITLHYDSMYVSNGGVANSTTVNSYGHLYVSSGGTANSTTVNAYGNLYVSSGGTATNIVWTPCVGNIHIADGAYTTFVSHYSGCYFGSNQWLLSSNMSMDGKSVNGAMLYVMQGGIANSTTVNSGGILYVSSGGIANYISVQNSFDIYTYTEYPSELHVFSGGIVNDASVGGGIDFAEFIDYEEMQMHLVSQYCGGFLYVSNGGTANETSVLGRGSMYILNGGIANSTFIIGGHVAISSGGEVENTILCSGEPELYRYEDGAVNEYERPSVLSVCCGGTANSTTVNSTCSMCVSSGGTALSIVENGGYVLVDDNATVTFIPNSFSGVVLANAMTTVHSGTTANSTTIGSLVYHHGYGLTHIGYYTDCYGWLDIFSCGMANNTVINPLGYLRISNGGVANRTIICGGNLYVSSGGTVNETTVSSYFYNNIHMQWDDRNGYDAGNLHVANGGKAENTTVGYEGNMYVSSGGTANSTMINSYGNLYVSSGGTANSTTINPCGHLYVSSGGTTLNIVNSGNVSGIVIGGDKTTVLKGVNADGKSFYISNGIASNVSGSLDIMSGGIANSTTVNSFGRLSVSSGGTANSTTINPYAHLYVSSGGTALNVVNSGNVGGIVICGDKTTVLKGVNADGKSFYISNGIASNVSGSLDITSGGIANSTTVNSSGNLYVSSGGTALCILENGGYVSVDENASVTFVSNSFNGLVLTNNSATLHSGTTANSTTVNSSGLLHVSSGGTANGTTVNSRGLLHVSSGGTANSTTVNSYGWFYVASGGTANSTTVNSYGGLSVFSGGVIKGTLQIESGACVSTYTGAKIDFNIAERTPSSTALINDWSLISDGSEADYTITVMTNQTSGKYLLASGASGFSNTITVKTETEILGTLTVGSSFICDKAVCSLSRTSGDLVLDFECHYFSGLIVSGSSSIGDATVIDATVISGGKLYLLDGGKANNTNVNYSGCFIVSSGGTALSIVENGGYVSVDENASVTFVSNSISGLVLSYTSATIHSGTTANNNEINSYGHLYVFSGGMANSTTVNGGGDLYVSSGGTALSIVENGGYVSVNENASVTFASNSFSGLILSNASATLHSGTTANNNEINYRGKLYVFSGGMANSTTINTSGALYVSIGGTVNCTTVSLGGNLYISSGGTANSTTVNSSGDLYVSSGGTANSTIINTDGVLHVSSGGTANNTMVNSYGRLSVFNGGTVNSTTVNSYGQLYVSSGGTANNTIINTDGVLHVSSGGTASYSIVDPWKTGSIVSETGATVTSSYDTLVYWGNSRDGVISKGSTLQGLTITSSGELIMFEGGILSETIIDNGGDLHVISGRTADSTTVNSNGWFYVSSGGTANSTTVNGLGNLFISSGGMANSTTINDCGNLFVSSGGTALSIVENGGYVSVDENASVTFASNSFSGLVLTNNSATLHSGTTANSTTVNSSGLLHISSGGTANSTTVNAYGYLYVSSGGMALSILENGGYVSMDENASVIFAVNSFSGLILSYGSATLHSGTTANITTVDYGGRLYIYSGGIANSTTINRSGYLYVSSGGIANITTVNSRGDLYVASGGIANSTMVNADGNLYVCSGGTANATILSGVYCSSTDIFDSSIVYTSSIAANLYISSGGTANGTTVNSDGWLYVFNGGFANGMVLSGGVIKVKSGGMAADITQYSGSVNIFCGGVVRGLKWNSGCFQLSNGAVASDVQIAPDASGMVLSGGSACNWIVSAFGTMRVSSGGFLQDGTVYSSATCSIDSGCVSGLQLEMRGSATVYNGQVDNLVMGSSARVDCYASGRSGAVYSSSLVSGGVIGSNASAFFREHTIASALDITKAGILYIDNGGTACSTTVDRMGRFVLFGTAQSTFLNGGSMYIGDSSWRSFDSTGGSVTSNKYDDDLVASYNVLSSSWLHVYSGASAKQNIVNSNSWLHVYYGGSAIDTEVNSSGYIVAQDSGTIDTVTVHSGGYMRVNAGATLNGMISVGGEMAVSSAGTSASEDVIRAYGADINYLLTERSVSDGAIISNLGMIQGATYYATVSEQQGGRYCLAKNAGDFTGYISIQNTEGTELAYCSVNETSSEKYRLSVSDNTLYLSISGGADTEKPVISNIRQDITAPTEGSVFVTADFTDNVAVTLKKYRIDNGQWVTYADGVRMTQNGTITFYAADAAKNEIQKTYSVTNIHSEVISCTGNFTGKGGVFRLMSDGMAYVYTQDGRTELTGTVDTSKWEIAGVGDFNKSGHDGLLWVEKSTGYVYMQYDMTSLAEVTGKTNCLGVLDEGYSIKAAGDFTGNDIAGALLQGPAFGDKTVSLNYGLPVWAREDDGSTFNGWLGALVNTWQEGDSLKGDLTDPASINANNYQYAVVGVGDFNGDGVDDVMLQNTMPKVITEKGVDYTITGSGDVFTFLTGDKEAVKRGDAPTVCYAGCATDGWEVLGFGDFNADGIDDALLSDGTGLAGWKMANGQRQDNFWFGNLGTDEEFAGIADFNADGTDDILVRNTATESLTAWTVKNGAVTGKLAIK